MKSYATVFSMLFCYMFRRGREKTSRWLWIAYIIIAASYAFIAYGICASVYSVAKTFDSLNLLASLVTVIFATACVAVILFGLIPMVSYLYFSKDNEFMMTLPVRPSAIFLAKLTVVYLTELLVGSLVMIPALVTVGIAVGLNAWYYVTVILAAFVVPAIPMVIVSLLAIPLMYVVSFFRNKGAVASVAMILLFGAVFGGYYAILGKLSGGGDVEIDPDAFVAAVEAAFTAITRILFPLSSVAYLAVGAGKGFAGGKCDTAFGEFDAFPASAINIGVFLISAAVLITLAALVSGAVYRKSASKISEGGGKKPSAGRGEAKTYSPIKALFKKEWREMFRTPAFAFQCLGGVVLCPIVLVFFATSMRNGFTAGTPDEIPVDAQTISLLVSFLCVLMTSVMGISMNVGASTAFTREGKNFYVLKTIPVEYKTIVKAKLSLYLIISSVTVVVSSVIGAVLAFHPINFVCGLLFMLTYNYGYNCFCLFFDLVRPKLNWVTQNEAVKNNRNAVLPMLINMGVSLLLILVPTLFITLIPVYYLALALTWAILFAVAITVAVVFHNVLFANCDRLFNRASV